MRGAERIAVRRLRRRDGSDAHFLEQFPLKWTFSIPRSERNLHNITVDNEAILSWPVTTNPHPQRL
jgi:hypothetical protein